MRAMPKEPEESKCEIKDCNRVGITNRCKWTQGSILLCRGCARVWDIAAKTTRKLMED